MRVIKLTEWYLKWYELYRENGIRDVTADKYMYTLKLLKKHPIGKMEIKRIAREDAQRYVADYGRIRSKLTVMDHLQTLRSCMGDAHTDGLIDSNPFARIQLVYKEQRLSFLEQKELMERKKWLEVDEYERLKSFLLLWLNKALEQEAFTFVGKDVPKANKAQMTMMIIFMALKTGARYSEILGITRNDVQVETNEITIDKTWDYKRLSTGRFLPTKNHASMRKVLVDQETMDMIKKMSAWQDTYGVVTDSETLFCEKGLRHYNSTINNVLEKTLTSLGIEPISLHKLRHTQASYLLAKGVSIQVVAKRLGHTDTKMVQRTYGHLLQETEEEANRQILKFL